MRELSRASHVAKIKEFVEQNPTEIVGKLTISAANLGFASAHNRQIEAWVRSIEWLQKAFCGLILEGYCEGWMLILEYSIPRRQKRIDATILTRSHIVLLELKTGDSSSLSSAREQVEDYALDLRDFHLESKARKIVPVVIRGGGHKNAKTAGFENQSISETLELRPDELTQFLSESFLQVDEGQHERFDHARWIDSPYAPVPTIIESARALYGNHNVREITHASAGVENLTKTSHRINEIVKESLSQRKFTICFVTGVPGSGKTLAGLNAAHEAIQNAQSPPVFLTGNGPLVKIVCEALAIDEKNRTRCSIREARHKVSTFVQNVHSFMRHYWEDAKHEAPLEQVVIFDEAQRAWSAEKNLRKFGRDTSEPEMMLEIMGRHPNGAVIIALVGEQQEIHDGEAGLEAWWQAISTAEKKWYVHYSDQAIAPPKSRQLNSAEPSGKLTNQFRAQPDLHLRIPVRSIRSQSTADWVNLLLAGDIEAASRIAHDLPIRTTRSLSAARAHMAAVTRGTRRTGMVASSDALRLRAFGIEMSTAFHADYPIEHWFLKGKNDVRSSFALEFAATEFECQGLELDNVLMCWANDLCWDEPSMKWRPRKFIGEKWAHVQKAGNITYALNKYRVLLTRFRESMLIWIPPGKQEDATVKQEDFDSIANVLFDAGILPL